MITQEITYYPDTFKTKEYKEYYNGVLNVHSKYDENNNKVYLYLAYEDLEWERRFEEGSTNDNGEIIYYKDNKGNFKLFDDNEFEYKVLKDDAVYHSITIAKKNENQMIGKAKLINGVYNCHWYQERLSTGDVIKYNQNYSYEIYYEYWEWNHDLLEYRYTGNRKIITVDDVMELTRFKNFFLEHKICPVTEKYLLNTVRKKTAENLFFSK